MTHFDNHALEVQFTDRPHADAARDAMMSTLGDRVERVVTLADPSHYASLVRKRGTLSGPGLLLGATFATLTVGLGLVIAGLAAGWPAPAVTVAILLSAMAYGMIVGGIAGYLGTREITDPIKAGLTRGHPLVRVAVQEEDDVSDARNFLAARSGARLAMSAA